LEAWLEKQQPITISVRLFLYKTQGRFILDGDGGDGVEDASFLT
jgi:hypothetical protein